MEEVDKIIIQSLLSIGCEINQDIKSISQFDQDLFIESVAKLLNTLNSGSNEVLPTKLPPNTGVKFRICTKFAATCQQLGYKNEIGYQTFLYLNETDMRRLLMFLVEKLTKDITSSSADVDKSQQTSSKRSRNLNLLIAEQIKYRLNQLWIPPYCKLNGLRAQEENKFIKEGCKFENSFQTLSLSIPYNYLNLKAKNAQAIQEYADKYCQYINNQAIRRKTDLLSSLMEQNLLERIQEQTFLKQDLTTTEAKREQKVKALNELKYSVKSTIKQINEFKNLALDNKSSCLSESDMLELEQSLQMSSFKNLMGKGSRFTHSEKLQFTKEDDQNIPIVSGSSEEKREEEIKTLKEELDALNKNFENMEIGIKKLNEEIEKLEQDYKDQTDLNKKIEEKIAIKQKTVNLLTDIPMNTLKLKEQIKNHEKKMSDLQNQWEAHKKPLEEQREQLKQSLENKKVIMQQKLDEIKLLRNEIDNLNTDLTSKEKEIKDLTLDLNKISKEPNKITNRQFYTRRIIEIVGNIDKQKKEIDKILIETRMIQKEINQLSGKLERIFNANDELLFKDAKKDETNKKVYRLFVSINEGYEKLISTIEESSHFERDIRDLEDQITSESQNKVDDNMEMVSKDLKQIKEENEQLISKLKSKKN